MSRIIRNDRRHSETAKNLFAFRFGNGHAKGKTRRTHIWEISARVFLTPRGTGKAIEKRTARDERTKTNEQTAWIRSQYT